MTGKKRILLIANIIGITIFSFLSAEAQRPHDIWTPPLKHGVAAQVEHEVITFEELRKRIAPLIPEIRKQANSLEDFTKRMNQVYLDELQRRIDEILITKDFRNKQYQIPKRAIDSEFERILRAEFNDDRSKFLKHLESEGINAQQFRKKMEENIIVYVMRREKIQNQAEVSPEEVTRYYLDNKDVFLQQEQVKIGFILLKPGKNEEATIEILAALKAGMPFKEVAQKFSQGNRKPEQKGKLSWRTREDLREELREKAFSMKPGAFSNPIKIENKVFIIFIADKKASKSPSLEEVRDRIEGILLGEAIKKAQTRWLGKLRKDAYIKYY